MSEQYFSTVDVASVTGISKSTLEKWRVAGGGIPYIKAGRLIRYARSDVDAWMAERKLTSTSA